MLVSNIQVNDIMAASEQEALGSASRSTLLTRPQTCHEDRYQGYKTLIQNIAERLGPEDVRSIAFNQDLPDHHRQPTALEVLQQLERHGLFSHTKIQPLADLLESIHRNDLVNKHVEPYQTKYGRHSSMPESASPNMAVRNRKLRPHSFPSQVMESVNVIEEKQEQAVQETGEVFPQASYTHVHMPETSDNSLQHRLQVPTYTTETQSRPQLQTSQQQIPQFSNHSYTHMRPIIINRPVGAQPFPQSHPQLSESFEGISHTHESSRADHSRYSEQVSSQLQAFPRTSTPVLNQQYMTASHPSFENAPIAQGIPATTFVPIKAFVQSQFLQPQAIITQNHLIPRGSVIMNFVDSDHEVPSHGSSQNASQSASLSGTQEMTPDTTEQYGRGTPDSMPTIKPPNTYGYGTRLSSSNERQNAAYWYQSPSSEDLLHAQSEQHFESSPIYTGFLASSYSRPTNHGYVLQPGYNLGTSVPSSFERIPVYPKLAKSQTEGHIRSLTPTLSTGTRRTSAPEKYLQRSSGSVNRIQHAPGFHTQHIHRTNYSSRSSIATSDSGLDMENLKSPSQNSAIGIQAAEKSSMQQPSDDQYTEVLPTHHEAVDALDSRMRHLQLDPHSNVTKGSSGAESGRLGRPRSGSPLKRFKHRRKSWGSNTQVIQWPLKRNDLNKIVYEHKTEKCLRSPEKLELKYAAAKANPKLAFRLYPYGLEDDYGKNATLEIEIKIPAKNCPPLPSLAIMSLTVTAWDCKEECRLNSVTVEKPMNLRQFTIPEFITHAALKESHSDYIEIQASAELIGLTVEPQ